jgi:AcrR family transcriptional regulator
MTPKKAAISLSALKLFSTEGYRSTSTKKIAENAGVSEALIFRHFGNKKGLLNSLIHKIEERFISSISLIVAEKDPKKVIEKTIIEAFNSMQIEPEYWNLNYQLKKELKGDLFWRMDLIFTILLKEFKNLNVDEPEYEAKFLVLFLEGMGSELHNKTLKNTTELLSFVMKKYKL